MIKRKFSRAVGLRYDASEDEVPSISVKGDEISADEVVKIAKRFGIPVVERRELAKALSFQHLDEEISEALYQAVAVLINEIESKTQSK